MTRSNFGHIEYLGPDYYRLYWYEGKRRRSKRFHGTRDAAEVFLAHLRIGDGLEDDVPWSAYWERSVVPTFDGLAVKTVADYEMVWNRELAPRIGARMVSTTDWRLVERTLAKIEAPSTQRKAFRLWRKMCNLAIRDGILDRNPCDRNIRMREVRRREKTLYTAEEVTGILDAVRGTLMERLVLMELCAGLRHEEAMAMTAEDVREDCTRAVLSVSKAVIYFDGRLTRKETKTAYSDREVMLSGNLAERLLSAKWPTRQQLPTTVTHNWRDWCGKNGVKYVRFGDMRSNFATLACECCDSSLVSLALGHGDGTTRGRFYQQSTRRGMEIVADAFADYVREGPNGGVIPA